MKQASKRYKRCIYLLGMMLLTAHCSPKLADLASEDPNAGKNGGVTPAPQFSTKVYDGETLLASEGENSGTLNMLAGKSYRLTLSVVTAPVGTTYTLTMENTSVLEPLEIAPQTLQPGDNDFSIPAAGIYSLSITAAATGVSVPKSFVANVACSNSNFSKTTLKPAAMTVTKIASASNNLFRLSAAGVIASADGSSPYYCAWDPTGTGIRDTGFSLCNGTIDFYSNFIGDRKVGLIVRDACNRSHKLENTANFASQNISAESPYIHGRTSNGQGSALNDLRVNDVEYLATNKPNNSVVSSWFDPGKNTFQIKSNKKYSMQSSVLFGMQLDLNGFTNTINRTTGVGSIDATNAKITRVSFSTDQGGDSIDQLQAIYVSDDCDLSNVETEVTFASATCFDGTPAPTQTATITISGEYSCNRTDSKALSKSDGSVEIQGEFKGLQSIRDACVDNNGGNPPPGT